MNDGRNIEQGLRKHLKAFAIYKRDKDGEPATSQYCKIRHIITEEDRQKAEKIIDIVCESYPITRNEIFVTRKKDCCTSRYFVYLMLHCCGYSLSVTATLTDGKDHTTILHGINNIKSWYGYGDKEIIDIYNRITTKLIEDEQRKITQ